MTATATRTAPATAATITPARSLVLDPKALERDAFDWSPEVLEALLPKSFDDFLGRRGEILHRHALPLYVPPDGTVPPPGFLGRLPWLPPAGPDFVGRAEKRAGIAFEPVPLAGLRGEARAAALAETATRAAAYHAVLDVYLEYLYCRALYDPEFTLKVGVKGRFENAPHVSGTFSTPEGVIYGPRRADVLVCSKYPGQAEVDRKENFVGPTSRALDRAFRECRIPDDVRAGWYFTNLVKHPGLDPSSTRLEARWIKNGAPLLALELRLVQPRYILCLGSESSQHLIAAKANVTRMYGRVIARTLDDRPDDQAPPSSRTVHLMSVIHPASVARDPKGFPDLANGLGVFHGLVQGARTVDRELDVEHVVIYTERHLRAVVDRILQETPRTAVIAVDAEWHGDHPDAPGSYLRTIQFSHRAKTAYCVVLRRQGGEPVFRPGLAAAQAQLRRLLKSTKERKVRVGGHYFRADFPWLKAFGLDLLREYRPASTWAKTKTHGGWDTVTMAHAFQEAVEGGYKLENLAARLVHVPRYDMALLEWKERYCRERQLKAKDLEGYGECPDDVLHPYALYDVDATIRLFHYFNGDGDTPGALDCDSNGRNCRRSFWTSHIAMPAQLEMEAAGLEVDRARGDLITQDFMAGLDDRLGEFRDRTGWARFNPKSVNQCRELLFGTRYNGSIDKATGENKRLRPPGVRTLGLTPVKAAGNKAPTWDRVVADGAEAKYNPSTDKESLGILGHAAAEAADGETVTRLRDLRFLGQVLQGVLRKPTELAGEYLRDEDDQWVYDGGLLYWVGHDGRVRTHFGIVETSRWSSWSPNLQNITKNREGDYQRILGPRYRHPIRSIVRARDGCVLVEADYKMAEMAVIGWLAQDPTMMDTVVRNGLPESHPDFVDPHARMAVDAFRLDTPANRRLLDAYNARQGTAIPWGATKGMLKAIGRPSLRVAAKNVNFGVPYGRAAEAIARQCRMEGADVTVAEAQALIDSYHRTYPEISVYLAACMARVHDPGWICGTFGDYRRFAPSDDRMVVAEMERQACNFGIQNAVARAINLACRNLEEYRRRHTGPETFTMCLQIHDALLFEVPIHSIDWLIREVLPTCMRDRVPIEPLDLDGNPLGVGPYHLEIDTSVERWWGEKIDRDWGLQVGVPEQYLPAPRPAA